ncbi:helix-turn-helix transcriptional regulator, partial [Salmonella enterica subsp. enterica serovar Istanbul]|nr:helix-turn-helix transcriptional regulator [Salmonella enterica subsp. enterica serovar Istanbul]
AEASDVLQRSITEYEAGRTVPEEETLRRLAKALRFPIEFFEGPEQELPEEHSVSFRSMASMKASQRDAARGAGAIAFELQQWIDERFKLPTADIPDMKGMPPEQAAASLREK